MTFKSLGAAELHQILDIELMSVHERIFRAMGSDTVMLALDERAREFLLEEGTDSRYGARHLKRAIETRLTQPLSKLIAGGQVHAGEQIVVECEGDGSGLIFLQGSGDSPDELSAAA